MNKKSKKKKKVKIKIKSHKQRKSNIWKNFVHCAKNLNVVFSVKAIADVPSMKSVKKKCKMRDLIILMTLQQRCKLKNFVWRTIN